MTSKALPHIGSPPSMEDGLAKVFLSYAREDAPVAKELAECIGRGGHDVWWDHQIHGGSRFASEIDRELKGADAVVVLWTEASIEFALGTGRSRGRARTRAAGSRYNGRLSASCWDFGSSTPSTSARGMGLANQVDCARSACGDRQDCHRRLVGKDRLLCGQGQKEKRRRPFACCRSST